MESDMNLYDYRSGIWVYQVSRNEQLMPRRRHMPAGCSSKNNPIWIALHVALTQYALRIHTYLLAKWGTS